ncbi:MAG TPA: FCD domain-containing protein [Methylomirabilota bacterium]|nr:FCD domain-containing protein [Methylomirabilota bacterium]
MAQEMGLQIVRGTLQPGDPLPIETRLSAQFGISRPAVREAIKILAGKGLVQSRPKTGTRVRPRQDWNFLDADMLTWQLAVAPAGKIVRELFELRRVIEPAAAALAAARAPPPHLRRLRVAYEDMVTACDRESGFLEPDMRFHRTILEAVDNEMLRSLATVVDTALSLSLRLSIDNPRGQRYSLPLHKAVLDAIAGRAAARARQAMLRLIEDAERDVRRVMRRRGSTARGSASRPRLKRES